MPDSGVGVCVENLSGWPPEAGKKERRKTTAPKKKTLKIGRIISSFWLVLLVKIKIIVRKGLSRCFKTKMWITDIKKGLKIQKFKVINITHHG
jgi:hypothetical protein